MVWSGGTLAVSLAYLQLASYVYWAGMFNPPLISLLPILALLLYAELIIFQEVHVQKLLKNQQVHLAATFVHILYY